MKIHGSVISGIMDQAQTCTQHKLLYSAVWGVQAMGWKIIQNYGSLSPVSKFSFSSKPQSTIPVSGNVYLKSLDSFTLILF